MLHLPDVTLACLDTVNPSLALRALLKSCEGVRFGRVALLTTRDAVDDAPDPVEIVPVAPLDSREAYSRFLLKELAPHVATSHVLIAQWDGYVVNPAAWDPAFLHCDYLGAKWFWYPDHMRVGNGGFSLRSRRLLEALGDGRIRLEESEDLTICRTFRPLLERDYGIRFGDDSLADRFSFEAAHPVGRPFGFHGLFNFCRVVPPAELAELATGFTDAIARSPQCAQLLRNCIALAQWTPAIAIARRMLAASANDATRALLAHAEAAATAGVGIGRNDPCPCGSGRRYKQCHGAVGIAAAATNPRAQPRPEADNLVTAGLAAHQRGDLARATQCYRAALAVVPAHPHAIHFLGVAHYQHNELDRALELLRRAVDLQPDEPEFHNNLGLALARAGSDAEALDAFHRALALRPDHPGTLNNLGLSLRALNRVDEAITAYRRALSLQPDFAQVRWNLALALLARGDFAEGWREYETRLALGIFQSGADPVPGPRWDGGDPRGSTILLTAEQGLGDAIQFVRLANALVARGAVVVVRAPAPLVTLFRGVPGVSAVVGPADPLPRYDTHVPMLSLPGMLGIGAGNVPSEVPYLHADAALRRQVREELRRFSPGPRVGLAWEGNRRNADDLRRSTTLAALASLFSVPGLHWFSLQKDDSGEIPGGSPLVRIDARKTMDGTAALIAELDLVISVDTSIAHLAGAIGRDIWLLLAYAADWRWSIGGERSSWYPQARLFRQPSPGNWTAVAEAVSRELRTLADLPSLPQ